MKRSSLFLLIALALVVFGYGGIVVYNKLRMTGDRWGRLTPSMKRKVQALLDKAAVSGLSVMFFDGWRSPEDEQADIDKGVSKLKDPYNTVHVWGSAADIVFDVAGVPSWPDLSDPRWTQLRNLAADVGLVHPISWDGPHFQDADFSLTAARSEYGQDYLAYLSDEGISV